MKRLRLPVLSLLLSLTALWACGVGSAITQEGAVRVRLSGTATGEGGIDNAWVTVRAVRFHRLDTAEPEDPDWVGWRFPDGGTVTLNLAALRGGALRTVFPDFSLPAGRYRQAMLFLEPTRADNDVLPSARAAGLRYNNQVDRATGPSPLRVPDAGRGIRLPGAFEVREDEVLDLAIDLDIGHDAVRVLRGAAEEYILKPLPRVFDLSRAGAIVGRVDAAAAADNSAFLEFRAEQPDGAFRVVRRTSALADNTGRFVLYPLEPGRYDVVLGGRNRRTVIVRNVAVFQGGTPDSGAANLGTIPMPAGTEYRVDVSVSPAGSRVHFYQRLPNDPVPYEVRIRHVDPFTGRLPDNLFLPAGHPRAGNYVSSGGTISFFDNLALDNALQPLAGAFQAVAAAPLHDRIGPVQVTPADDNLILTFGRLPPSAPALPCSAQGQISMSAPGLGLGNGILFAVRGGQIVDRLDVSARMGDNGGPWLLGGLPGGSALSAFPQGVYGIDTLGWSDNALAAGFRLQTLQPAVADLSRGNRTGINLWMVPLR